MAAIEAHGLERTFSGKTTTVRILTTTAFAPLALLSALALRGMRRTAT